MLTLYKSMVRSLVEYCCPLWHPSKISDIQELESVQKTFISRITGMKELHYYDQLIHLSLMSLQRRRECFILLHMWKILHGQTSNDLNVQFVSRSRLGTLAIIPSKSRTSSAANQTVWQLICCPRPEIVERNAAQFEQHPESRALQRSAHQVPVVLP